MLEITVLSVGVIKSDSILGAGGNHNIFFMENRMEDWISIATLAK